MQALSGNLGLRAANLYSEGFSFGRISEKLEVSKSRVGKLIREGILSMADNDGGPDEAVVVQVEGERGNAGEVEEVYPLQPKHLVSFPQGVRPGSYTLETSGTPKRIVLTPKALMVFDIFSSCGFTGDLSDFIEDAINYMYQTRMPSDRGNYR